MRIKRLGLVVNIFKSEIRNVLGEVIDNIPEKVKIVGQKEISDLVKRNRVEFVDNFSGCDIVISLGGDGTLLRASRMVEAKQIPLLGLKIRSLGFLTEDNPAGAVRELFEGRFIIQDRMRLHVSFGSEENGIKNFTALNDIVLHGVGVSRVLHLRTSLDNTTFGEYLADGVIIATPTGSTAYSLAAGGPIINPVSMEGIIITPLCPHSLSVRPIVVSSHEVLQIEVVEECQETMLTIDGQEACSVKAGEVITIKKSERVTKLVTGQDYNFYDLVRKKLKWGGVLRRH